MDGWEYFIFTGDLHGMSLSREVKKSTLDYLNQLGREGWELVNAIKTLSNALLSDEYSFFFKRKIG